MDRRCPREGARRLFLPWVLAAAFAAAAGLLALRARAPQPVATAPAAFGVALPPGNILPRDEASTLDVSEDGRTIVFVAESSVGRRLFRRTLGKVDAVPIEGTARAFHPFLSPDGRWVGFFSDGKIRKVPIEGGASVTLASVTAVRGATWRADGWIVFTTGYAGGLYRVRDGGGTPEPITTLDASRGERTHRWPASVAGTDWVLFTAANTKSVSDYEGARIDAVNVRTKERRTILEGARYARFAPPDHLLVLRRAALVAYRLDPARLTVGSETVTVLDDVGGEASSGAGFFAAGGRGVLSYVPGAALQEEKLLVSVDMQGRETPLPLEPRSYFQPRFSPDGARLAFSIGSGQAENDDVWTYDLREKRMSRFTFQPGSAIPAWSPDGKWIAFSRGRGATGLYRKRVDGTSEEERLSGEDGPNFAEGYTPDGKLLTGTKSERALSVLGVPIGGKPFKLIESSADVWGALVSPSGRYVAYVSTETGSDEVFIETYPAGRGKWQVSLGGGRFPLWSRDSRRLVFVKDEEIMAVDVDDRGAFHASEPRTLFRGPYELRTAPDPELRPRPRRAVRLRPAPHGRRAAPPARGDRRLGGPPPGRGERTDAMTLASGAKLGPYEILAPLGAGGMGEVYRARDTRVDRAVALKVLPEEFFESEERRGRFEREARMLASLNHPGIAILYSFEEVSSSTSSSRHLLAMELVEGEDLAHRIASGPLSLEESLSFARQIAEALAAAHDKGIVHRDLKPANARVTPGGRVKLLDFGLAKAIQAWPAETNAPTAAASPTLAGAVLGTPAYMSPEQARGDTVDARTDVWAFGCLVYEMVTRRATYRRRTTAETLAAVLGEKPRLDEAAWRGAPALRALVSRCLEREPALRPDSGRDLVRALAETRPRSAGPRVTAIAATAAAVVVVVVTLVLALRRPGTRPSAGPLPSPSAAAPGGASPTFALYEKARAAYLANTKVDNTRAIALYDEALRVDPKYAPAWAGLAFACARYSFQYFDADPAWAGRAEEAAARALEYGPFLAEAHQARAQVLSSQHQNFDFRRALPEARRALELSPNLDIAHYWLGVGYGLHLGLFDEGLRSLERAAEINPKWAAPVASTGYICLQQGRYDDALASARKAVEMAPGFSVAYVALAEALLRQGRDAEADAEITRALEKEPRNTWALSLRAVLAARRGARAEADALIEKAAALYDDHHVQYNAALVAAARGDGAGAVARLRKAVAGNFNPYGWYATDPLLGPVRSDAPFRTFLEESKRTFEADRVAFAAR